MSGTVAGPVAVNHRSRSGAAGRTLLRIGLPLIVVLAIADIALALARSAVHIIVAVLPIVIVVLLMRAIFFSGRDRGRSSRRGHGGSLVASVGRAGGRAVAGAVSSTSRAGAGLPDADVEVHNFRVDTPDGQRVDCELTGELRGPAPRQGDSVQVYGRHTRNGVVKVRRIVITTTGAQVRAAIPVAFHLWRLATVIAVIVLVGALVIVVQA